MVLMNNVTTDNELGIGCQDIVSAQPECAYQFAWIKKMISEYRSWRQVILANEIVMAIKYKMIKAINGFIIHD